MTNNHETEIEQLSDWRMMMAMVVVGGRRGIEYGRMIRIV